MARLCGFESMEALVEATVPQAIKRTDGMPLGPKYHEGMNEEQFLASFKCVAARERMLWELGFRRRMFLTLSAAALLVVLLLLPLPPPVH